MRIFFYILLILVVLLGITFAALNAESVTLHYYFGKMQIPLSFLVVFSLVFGILFGWILHLTKLFRLKREIFILKNKLKQANEHKEHDRPLV